MNLENMALKLKISILWIIAFLTGLSAMTLEYLESDVITGIIDGQIEGMTITPELLLIFAIMLLIPLFMPFITLILKDSMNRWTNIIIGIIFTVLNIVGLADYIAKQSAYLTLLSLAGTVPTALIVWYAWKWPKQEA